MLNAFTSALARVSRSRSPRTQRNVLRLNNHLRWRHEIVRGITKSKKVFFRRRMMIITFPFAQAAGIVRAKRICMCGWLLGGLELAWRDITSNRAGLRVWWNWCEGSNYDDASLKCVKPRKRVTPMTFGIYMHLIEIWWTGYACYSMGIESAVVHQVNYDDVLKVFGIINCSEGFFYSGNYISLCAKYIMNIQIYKVLHWCMTYCSLLLNLLLRGLLKLILYIGL